ncbi:hypothetical protein [Tabrizicola aquatica]|uniref:hypothetical protein n=1 Tax=Tabrizicola aquatica TaxID=909926 RepID=UPI0011AF8536|nr:hypothetical protein [Tabrizicola aquatica]
MPFANLVIHTSCFALAVLLFLLVNWIGRHAVSFGYSSTTLFEDPEESFALNFLLRTLPPAVFIIILSAGAVASGNDELRLQSYWIAVYYYIIRAGYFPIFGLQRLISWRRFVLHSTIGILAAAAAFKYLVLPKKSLLPDLETAGNELWLAMLVFLYAVGNNVVISDSRSATRRNSYVRQSYNTAHARFGAIIDEKIKDDLLKLIVYAVIVFENYCRPPVVRALERAWPMNSGRTTGIMQVASPNPLSDEDSIRKGLEILSESWNNHMHEETWERIRSVVADYNKDDEYVYKVDQIMEIIANRVELDFLPTFEDRWRQVSERSEKPATNRNLRVKLARFSNGPSPRRLSMRTRRKRQL